MYLWPGSWLHGDLCLLCAGSGETLAQTVLTALFTSFGTRLIGRLLPPLTLFLGCCSFLHKVEAFVTGLLESMKEHPF